MSRRAGGPEQERYFREVRLGEPQRLDGPVLLAQYDPGWPRPGSPEVDRHLRFRDHLRSDAADRELYERTKRELAARRWTYVQQYADAKGEVIEAILLRSQAQ